MGLFGRKSRAQKDPELALHDVGDAPVVDAAAADLEVPGTDGPYDVTEVPGLQGRLDMGSMWIAGVPGMELRLEVDQQQNEVTGATAVLGPSAVQLQAWAAPTSGGLWTEIREEIAESIVAQGGSAEERDGVMGTELFVQIPQGDTTTPMRFAGVDGRRWFLRAVFSGAAATDDEAASTLMDVVRATVVVRGTEAMAPRELLPLQLPAEPEPQPEVEEPVSETLRHTDDLRPFERGPEITEIR